MHWLLEAVDIDCYECIVGKLQSSMYTEYKSECEEIDIIMSSRNFLSLFIRTTIHWKTYFCLSFCCLISSCISNTRLLSWDSNFSGNTTVSDRPLAPVQPLIAAALIWSYRSTTTVSTSFMHDCFSSWMKQLLVFIGNILLSEWLVIL